ncbi:hypothetical protein NN761_11060 [Bacteroides clarus]|uniref:hypothetical protein n=1 Tax=Bacteroides clarus TaxID=626929 RepID=UPI00210155E5|nr:hypothetical protein [Bacteroides clarus]MCQ1546109.1 hypothetical protein [Bacteroides clarus]
MAAEVLSFEKNENENAYYATFVSDGNPVTIQIKNKGGYVTVHANIEGMKPVILYPNVRDSNGAPDSIFRVAGIVAGVEITIKSATEVLEAKMIKEG